MFAEDITEPFNLQAWNATIPTLTSGAVLGEWIQDANRLVFWLSTGISTALEDMANGMFWILQKNMKWIAIDGRSLPQWAPRDVVSRNVEFTHCQKSQMHMKLWSRVQHAENTRTHYVLILTTRSLNYRNHSVLVDYIKRESRWLFHYR